MSDSGSEAEDDEIIKHLVFRGYPTVFKKAADLNGTLAFCHRRKENTVVENGFNRFRGASDVKPTDRSD